MQRRRLSGSHEQTVLLLQSEQMLRGGFARPVMQLAAGWILWTMWMLRDEACDGSIRMGPTKWKYASLCKLAKVVFDFVRHLQSLSAFKYDSKFISKVFR